MGENNKHKFIRFGFLVLILITLPGARSVVAQTVLTVQDSENGRPLESVVIMTSPPSFQGITNNHGKTVIPNLADSTLVEFRLLGYELLRLRMEEIRTSAFIVTLKPSRLSLEQVVISATRWNQVTTNLPQKVTTLKPRDIQLHNPQTAADLLGINSQVFIQKSQQGGGSPMIRGFSANRLLYAVDGVRMNTAIFRSGNLQNVISLDAMAMESAEILFGPGSVLYGSDAIGAVMDFRTLQPQLAAGENEIIDGVVTARYATANKEKSIHGHANIGFKRWAFTTSLTFTDYDDLLMGQHGPDDYLRSFYVERRNNTDEILSNPEPRRQIPSGYSQRNFMQKILFAPSKNWELKYAYHYSRLSEYDRYDRLIQERNGEPQSAEWKYGPQKWDMHLFTATNHRSKGPYDEMAVRTYYQRFEESRIDRTFNDPIRRNRIEMVDAYGINLDFTERFSDKTTFNYGAEYVFNDVTSNGMAVDIENGFESFPVASRYPDSKWHSAGFYALIQYKWTKDLYLQAGTRYTYYSLDSDFSKNQPFLPLPFEEASLNNGALSGNAGINYSPTSTFTLRLNLSTGFRAPNVDDIGKIFDSEPGSVVVPNPDLQAEYAWNSEIGISKVIGESVKIDVSAFYTRLDNAMVRRPFLLNGEDSIIYDGVLSQVQAIQNSAYSRVYGIQAAFEAILPWNLMLNGNINFQKGKDELDDGTTSPSRHAAPLFGMTGLQYRNKKLEIILYTQFSGERTFKDMPVEEIGKPYLYASDKNGNPYSPGWYTLNIKSKYEFGNNIILSAGLENLTNQRYRPYSSGLAGAGLNFIFALTARF